MSSTSSTSRPGPIVLRGKPLADGSHDQILVPPMRTQTLVAVRGWATGYGDPAAGANATADLALAVNGTIVGKVHETNFTLYNLEVEHRFLLAANTPTTIDLTYSNHIATEAGDPAHGVLATITTV